MPEPAVFIDPDKPRAVRYRYLLDTAGRVLPPCPDLASAMSLAVNLIAACFPEFHWVGFYRVVSPETLAIGPYRGTLPCVEIPFSRGVCGAAARTKTSLIVTNVEAFPGHIACDSASRSEIVVPLLRGRELLAVLDIDSTRLNDFSTLDMNKLGTLCAVVAGCAKTPRGKWNPSRTQNRKR